MQSKFSHYSLIGIHPTYQFQIEFFLSAEDMPLFCGEDLNFGAFSKYFSLGFILTRNE
jgi:hypothetical protein